MYHVDGGSGVQITKSKPAPTTPRKERAKRRSVWWLLRTANISTTPNALGGVRYNAQFPLWQIARKDRKTGDEDDIIQQAESAFGRCFRRMGNSSSM